MRGPGARQGSALGQRERPPGAGSGLKWARLRGRRGPTYLCRTNSLLEGKRERQRRPGRQRVIPGPSLGSPFPGFPRPWAGGWAWGVGGPAAWLSPQCEVRPSGAMPGRGYSSDGFCPVPLRPRATAPGLCQGVPRSSANHVFPWLCSGQWGVLGPMTARAVGLDPSLQHWPRPGHGLLPFYPQEHK